MNGGRRNHEASVSGLWELQAGRYAGGVLSIGDRPEPSAYERTFNWQGSTRGKSFESPQSLNIVHVKRITTPEEEECSLAASELGNGAMVKRRNWAGGTSAVGEEKVWVQRDTLYASCIDELAVPLRILKSRGADEATGTPWRPPTRPT